MAWELLPVNYTDAVWTGLKKYNEIRNEDGTVSFQDVTVYTGKETSFFGAKDANRMNEALNTIMSMVENGTDLYSAFQNYFNAQKILFEDTADATQQEFNEYVNTLKKEGDSVILTIKTDYRNEITEFENQQEELFTTWFEFIKGQLGDDVAGNLQNQIYQKYDKVPNAKEGNFPTFGIDSTLTDSGKKPSDFVESTVFTSHTDNTTIHTSTSEKQAWNKKADPIPETSDTATAEVTQALGETASYQFGTLTSLTLSGTRPSETVYYAYSIAFSSGSTPTTISVPEGWIFSGDDCADGVFVPVASKAYEMIGAWKELLSDGR